LARIRRFSADLLDDTQDILSQEFLYEDFASTARDRSYALRAIARFERERSRLAVDR
jgi:hypothetical protein